MNLLVLLFAEVLFWTAYALLWVIALPAAWILATPFIMVTSAFADEPYFTALRKKYRKIADRVSDICIEISP
jgi:hypothetical protein